MSTLTPPRGPNYEQKSAWMKSIRPASNKGKKYKRHKEVGPVITPERLVKAIKGSLGVMRRIARRLDVTPQAVLGALARPGFEEAALALHAETDGLKMAAVSTVSEMLTQRDEYKTALSAAKFVLDRKGGWTQKLALEGGDKPLRIESTVHQQVTLDSLDLPLDVRRQVLERLEGKKTPGESRPVLRVKRIV